MKSAGDRHRGEPALLRGDKHQPRGGSGQREAAPRPGLAVELRGADLNRQTRQIVSGVRGERPLHQPEVARPGHADPLAMPRLRAQPTQCRQSVGPLLEGAELALRAERPAHALNHDLETALGQQPPEDQPDRLPAAIRRAHEHRWLRLIPRRPRDPAVGQQHRPVIHLDPQISFTHHVVGLRTRQAHAPGNDRAGGTHDTDAKRPSESCWPVRRCLAAPGAIGRGHPADEITVRFLADSSV